MHPYNFYKCLRVGPRDNKFGLRRNKRVRKGLSRQKEVEKYGENIFKTEARKTRNMDRDYGIDLRLKKHLGCRKRCRPQLRWEDCPKRGRRRSEVERKGQQQRPVEQIAKVAVEQSDQPHPYKRETRGRRFLETIVIHGEKEEASSYRNENVEMDVRAAFPEKQNWEIFLPSNTLIMEAPSAYRESNMHQSMTLCVTCPTKVLVYFVLKHVFKHY